MIILVDNTFSKSLKQPRQPEDAIMEDAVIETNRQAMAALEEAKRREEVLMNNIRKQDDLVALLKRQLQEKEKEETRVSFRL